MDTPDSISTPSLATVFFDKFEKDELQEILTTKPLDWLFAQNLLDDKVWVILNCLYNYALFHITTLNFAGWR